MIFKVNITVSVNKYFNIFIVWSILDFSLIYALEILPANYTLETVLSRGYSSLCVFTTGDDSQHYRTMADPYDKSTLIICTSG